MTQRLRWVLVALVGKRFCLPVVMLTQNAAVRQIRAGSSRAKDGGRTSLIGAGGAR